MSEQPQSQRHRAEQDEPAHAEPSSPAAEHVASWYEVELSYSGRVWVDVLADSRDEAEADAQAMASVSDLQAGEWYIEGVKRYEGEPW